MKTTLLAIPEVIVFEPQVFSDDRGYFFESFTKRAFREATGLDRDFVQDNHSRSQKGVLRGLHYQLAPRAQGKLIRVVEGAILDVAVDVRQSSPTFGQWVSHELSAENKKQMWVPEGFAHGFIVLSNQADVLYKATDYYAPDYERCLIWNDATIGVVWPDDIIPILSSKDVFGLSLDDEKIEVFK